MPSTLSRRGRMKPVPRTYCPPIVTLRSSISTTPPVPSGPNIGRLELDQHRVDLIEHGGLPIDAVGDENVARGIEADHKNVRPQIPFATLPFGNSEIERH